MTCIQWDGHDHPILGWFMLTLFISELHTRRNEITYTTAKKYATIMVVSKQMLSKIPTLIANK